MFIFFGNFYDSSKSIYSVLTLLPAGVIFFITVWSTLFIVVGYCHEWLNSMLVENTSAMVNKLDTSCFINYLFYSNESNSLSLLISVFRQSPKIEPYQNSPPERTVRLSDFLLLKH